MEWTQFILEITKLKNQLAVIRLTEKEERKKKEMTEERSPRRKLILLVIGKKNSNLKSTNYYLVKLNH